MRRKLLLGIEAFLGLAAVVGGALLAAAPDARLLGMDTALLEGTPFSDYLVPGLLLACLIGGGGVAGAILTRQNARHAQGYGSLYATGVVAFEVVEYFAIGWWPLQGFVGALGVTMLLLALTAQPPGAAARRLHRRAAL